MKNLFIATCFLVACGANDATTPVSDLKPVTSASVKTQGVAGNTSNYNGPYCDVFCWESPLMPQESVISGSKKETNAKSGTTDAPSLRCSNKQCCTVVCY